jgi:hypothetical protein
MTPESPPPEPLKIGDKVRYAPPYAGGKDGVIASFGVLGTIYVRWDGDTVAKGVQREQLERR